MNEFKAIREKLKMTQVQFSEFLGIPLRTLKAYEADTNKPTPWVHDLIFEKISRYVDGMRVLPLVLDDDARVIYNELDEELLDGILKPTDTIKAVVIDNHLVDWYYNDDSKYYKASDESNIVSLSVRELMYFIERA